MPVAEVDEPDPLGDALRPALRGTREYQECLETQRVTAQRMREVANVFGATVEGMRAQLTPVRAKTLVLDTQREIELQALIGEARSELNRLKKANRDLASELQTTY